VRYISYTYIFVYINILEPLPNSIDIYYEDEIWKKTLNYECIPSSVEDATNMVMFNAISCDLLLIPTLLHSLLMMRNASPKWMENTLTLNPPYHSPLRLRIIPTPSNNCFDPLSSLDDVDHP